MAETPVKNTTATLTMSAKDVPIYKSQLDCWCVRVLVAFTVVLIIVIAGMCVYLKDLHVVKEITLEFVNLKFSSVEKPPVGLDPNVLGLVAICGGGLVLGLCALWCHIAESMVRERRRALKDHYDFLSNLLNTVKDMRREFPQPTGHAQEYRFFFNCTADATNGKPKQVNPTEVKGGDLSPKSSTQLGTENWTNYYGGVNSCNAPTVSADCGSGTFDYKFCISEQQEQYCPPFWGEKTKHKHKGKQK